MDELVLYNLKTQTALPKMERTELSDFIEDIRGVLRWEQVQADLGTMVGEGASCWGPLWTIR